MKITILDFQNLESSTQLSNVNPMFQMGCIALTAALNIVLDGREERSTDTAKATITVIVASRFGNQKSRTSKDILL